jgi:hypothetical protein
MAASRAGRQTVVHRRQRLRLAVGADAVGFNRAFAAAGFDSSCLRLSTLIDENTLAGSCADSTHGMCAAAAYEGLLLLSALAERAGSLDLGRMIPAAESLSYAGPRGRSKCIIATSRSASTSPRPTISSSTSSPGSDGGLAR